MLRIFFKLALLALACTGVASRALADGTDQQTPTFFVNATGGYSVYKSELVQSNDTSTTTSYGLGIWAGTQRNVGMALKRESSTFAFALNEAKLALDWQDTHVRYRFGPVYLGVMLSTSTWVVSAPPDADADGTLDPDADPEDYLDFASSGYGLNAGTTVPIGKRSFAYVDLSYAAAGTVRQKAIEDAAGTLTEKEIELGPRTDIDIGGSIAVTKSVLDALVGFKQRSYNVSVDGTAYKEQLNTTYVGFSAGWQF